MAYRASAKPKAGDGAVVCTRCAAVTTIAFAEQRDDRFRCERCSHEQPVLRSADDLEVEAMTLRDYGTEATKSFVGYRVTAVDNEFEQHTYSFRRTVSGEDVVKVGWRRGALGWRWERRDAIVVEASKR